MIRDLLDPIRAARLKAELSDCARVSLRGSALGFLLVAINALPGPGSIAPRVAADAEQPSLDQERYVRYRIGESIRYGILEGRTIHELKSSSRNPARPTGRMVRLADVELLPPIVPR